MVSYYTRLVVRYIYSCLSWKIKSTDVTYHSLIGHWCDRHRGLVEIGVSEELFNIENVIDGVRFEGGNVCGCGDIQNKLTAFKDIEPPPLQPQIVILVGSKYERDSSKVDVAAA